jgi:hypothetical protein
MNSRLRTSISLRASGLPLPLIVGPWKKLGHGVGGRAIASAPFSAPCGPLLALRQGDARAGRQGDIQARGLKFGTVPQKLDPDRLDPDKTYL